MTYIIVGMLGMLCYVFYRNMVLAAHSMNAYRTNQSSVLPVHYPALLRQNANRFALAAAALIMITLCSVLISAGALSVSATVFVTMTVCLATLLVVCSILCLVEARCCRRGHTLLRQYSE